MLQKDANYITMAAAAVKILDDNSAIWGGNVPFYALVDLIKNDLASINTAQKGGGAVSTGATEDKELAGAAAIVQAVKLSNLAQAYALKTKNNTLNNQIKVTTTQMERYSISELTPVLQNLHEQLVTVGTDLVPYGVTPAELDKLDNLTNLFKHIKSNTRVIITKRKSHNTNIPALITNLKSNFLQADKLINIWMENQKLMSDYQNARIVIAVGVRHDKKDDQGKADTMNEPKQ